MLQKRYFTYQEIHKILCNSAKEILGSGFVPDLIVAIGAGGFIPARILRTFLNVPIATITMTYYNDSLKKTKVPLKQQWLDKIVIKDKKILVVDEVDDSRMTLEYSTRALLEENPAELAVYVLHNKLRDKEGHFPNQISKIFVGEHLENSWFCYPWDAKDIDAHHEKHGEHKIQAISRE